ncbi:DUF4003 family protein [Aquibacillus sediminis]|uniref:DUF4003 family protein n=1 Tax=Aquibacillus sediminis TaxID=2574734 RepID=UPI00148696D9|nr:DUF4003 family protein [Aquibacillus sediminis]
MNELQNKIKDYVSLFHQLRRELKWKLMDDNVKMMIAASYVINKKGFDFQRFNQLSNHIKGEVGMFSTLKSHQRFTTAAMLDVRYQDPKNKFSEMMELYDLLVSHRFSRGAFTYIAALVLLSNQEMDPQTAVKKAMEIYKAMKKEHGILTSSSDYPLVAMLANHEKGVEELIERMEYFYHQLHDKGLRKGNDLQFLSHILSLDTSNNSQVLMDRCQQMIDAFRMQGEKIKPKFYPEVGMLSLVNPSDDVIRDILQVKDQLDQEKKLKWHKDMNFRMAVNFVISTHTEDSQLLETGMATTIETILQAQQAALIATMAGTTAAASSSSGGS